VAVLRACVVLVAVTGVAHAEQHIHAGFDLRTDLGTHFSRVAIGLRRCAWDATLVVDPIATLDGEHDLDLVGEYYVGSRVGVLFGWRWSAIDVAGGVHHQQRSLVGITGVGPAFFAERLRTSASLELSTLWVKHGGGVDADWISADRNLHDSFSLGLFVRIEYAHAL
jgi:hypothetical protein